MASLNEIVYTLKNLPNGGIQSDDTDISDAQIEFIVNYYRALLIKQEIDKKKRNFAVYEQDLGAVAVSLIDAAECVEIATDCDILRTVNRIPTPLDVNNSIAITAVQTVDGSTSFPQTFLARAKWERFNRWTPRTRKWYYKNGHVYVTNDEELETINIRGIFEDPRLVSQYLTCDNKVCWTADSEYPMAEWMIKRVVDIFAQGEGKILYSQAVDDTNNANDDSNTIRTQGGEQE
jgi:hypothetical protein